MEQLGYIAVGCVLVLVVLVLRRISIALAIHSVDRVDWSKIRLPTFGWRMSAWAPRTKNSVLLSIAVHAALALIGTLFIVTKDIEHDYIKVEWVKIPRPMRRVKTLEVKPVQPRIIPPRNLATHQATPNTKPVDVKVAASQSFAMVRDSVDLSVKAACHRWSRQQARRIPPVWKIPISRMTNCWLTMSWALFSRVKAWTSPLISA